MKIKILQHFVLIGFVLMMGGAWSFAQDFSITATIQQTTIPVNQQFAVTVEISGSRQATNTEIPTPQIDEFAAYTGSNQSSSFQFINGKMSASKTVTYYFIARKEGTFTVPSIPVDFEGKTYSTDPIQVEITKAAAGQQQQPQTGRQLQSQPSNSLEDNVYISAEVDKRRVFVGEPVHITYKIYTAMQVNNYAFRNKPSYGDFWAEEFPIEGSPKTHEEVINGKRFLVATLKKVALFPTSIGKKTIPPQQIDASVRVRERRQRRDFFDSFFDDPFFGRTVTHSMTSNSVEIDVVPLPTENKPRNFSGLVGRYSMTATLDKTRANANDAITLKIVIAGEGNIRTLPTPKINFPNNFEVYDPKVSEAIERDGAKIQGRKTFEYLFVPRLPGDYTLNRVNFTYFDLNQKDYRTLSRGPFDITVGEGEQPIGGPSRRLAKSDVLETGQDIRYIAQRAEEFTEIGSRFYKNPLLWFVLFAPVIGLVAAVYYRSYQDKMGTNVALARSRKAQKLATNQLKEAQEKLKAGDAKLFYTELGQALTKYIGNKLNIAESAVVTETLVEKLREKEIDDATLERVARIFQECDFHRFGLGNASDDVMVHAYEDVRDLIMQLEKKL